MKNTRDFDNFMSNHVNINPSRRDRLARGFRGVSEHLAKYDVFLKTEQQGSYALRTVIKPVNDHEYDLDMLVYMDYVPGKDPKAYIEDVYQCMRLNGNYKDKVRRETRSVLVDYSGEFRMDIVPCVTRGDKQYICNRKTGEFEPTDGTGFRDWFNSKNDITHGNLKLVTRLLKYLRDHKETFTAPSILLTTLIGYAVYDTDTGDEFRTLPDALVTVTTRINSFLQANPFMPIIKNPALREEDFVIHWDQDKYRNFRNMFASYTRRINDAFNETDGQRSVSKWRDLFGDGFGSSGSGSSSSKPIVTTAAGLGAATATVTPRKPYAR